MARLAQDIPHGPIALLTDYGWQGAYAGILKAVVLRINPAATIFDITHDVEPQAVESGAFILGQAAPFMPDGSTVVAVVDPGVGTSRAAIAVSLPRVTFVGPDNGLISGLLADGERPTGSAAAPVTLPVGCQGFRLVNPDFFLQPVSSTFHGRDVFAPVAAHLSLGRPLTSLGPAVDRIWAFPAWRAKPASDGSFFGRVISVDRFGNLITDIRSADLLPLSKHALVRTTIKHLRLNGIQSTFHDGPEFIVYSGSSGFLEIARRDASAAAALNAAIGEAVRIETVQQ
jgi:S-adenosyl-L-methionine hydrolase (adenosine-forming)